MRFLQSTLSISPVTCTTLAPSKFIRSDNYFLVSSSSIMTSIQFLINLESFVLPPFIWPVQSKISWIATGWWVPCGIEFINGFLFNVVPSSVPDRPKTSALVKRLLVWLSLMVEYHASSIAPLIVSLEVIVYLRLTFLDFKMMSSISLDSHVLKVNPLFNIRVTISTSRFFMISWNR